MEDWLRVRKHYAKGYTLIELVVVLGIICIICFIATVSIKALKKIENDINRQVTIQEVQDMLTYAKLYCVNNKVTGNIYANAKTGEYRFFSCKETRRRNRVKGDMKIIGIYESSDNSITINANGEAYAGAILLADKSGKVTRISIRVGFFYDEIKNK